MNLNRPRRHRSRTIVASVAASAARLAAPIIGVALLVAGGCASPAQPTLTKYKQPAGADAYVKAVQERRAGDDDAAIAELERALIVNPNLRMARMTLGEIYMERKNYDQAVPHLQAASDLDPYTLDNHYNLGLSLQVLNRLQESALAYLRGIRLAPEDFKTNMNLGLVYFALNQLDPAIYYLERATRIDAGNARAWSNIGVVYDARGNAVFAEASYRKALELDGANESTLINLTSNLITQKRAAEAVAVATQLVELSDTPLHRKRLGDAHTAAGQWSEAAASYDLALKMDPNFLPALNARAEMFIARYEAELRLDDKLRQEALAAWQQSLKLQPQQPAVVASLAKWQDPKVFK
jgi:protein O-GlcNAc transferase